MSFPFEQQFEVPMEVDDHEDLDMEMELLADDAKRVATTKQGGKRGTKDRPTESIADEPQEPPPLKRRKKKGVASEKTTSESDSAISPTSVASRLRSSNHSVDASIPLASDSTSNVEDESNEPSLSSIDVEQPAQAVTDNSTNENKAAAADDSLALPPAVAPVDCHPSSTVATVQTRTTEKTVSLPSVKPHNAKKSKAVEKAKAIKASRAVKPRLSSKQRTAVTRAANGNNSRVPRVDRRVKGACRDLAFVVTTAACCGLAAFLQLLKQPTMEQQQPTQILKPVRMNKMVPSSEKALKMLENKAEEMVTGIERDLFLVRSSPRGDVNVQAVTHDEPKVLVEEPSFIPTTVAGAVAQGSADELLLVHSSSPGDVDVAAMAHDESMETTGASVTTTEAVVQEATGGRLEETAPVAWILSVPTLDVIQAEVASSNSSGKVGGLFWNEPLVNVSGVVELVPDPDSLASIMTSGQKDLPIGSLTDTDWIDQFASEVGDLLTPIKSALIEAAPVGKQQPNTALDWFQLGLYWMEDFVCEPGEDWCRIVSGMENPLAAAAATM